MPTIEELNTMSQLITGRDYDDVSLYDVKGMIVQAAISLKRNLLLEAIQNDTDTIAQVMWK